MINNIPVDKTSDVEALKNTMGYTATKNWLEITATTTTKNDVTFTVNDDGGITVNGTATATTAFKFAENIALPNGEYILNGCPNGSSVGTYYLYMSGTGISGHDAGEGKTFVIEDNVISDISIYVKSGTTVSNVTFYPMIRKSDEPENRDVNVRLNSTPKIEIQSYVGTGTGSTGTGSNLKPVSMTFSFAPKVVIFIGYMTDSSAFYSSLNAGGNNVMISSVLTTEYKSMVGFRIGSTGTSLGKKSADGKTFYWYTIDSSNSPTYQLNRDGYTYYLLAIG